VIVTHTYYVHLSAITFNFYCRWTIKARGTAKSDIRRWSNAKGEGTLFNIDLLDSEGGEIRATFFKEACDKFFPILEAGKVYNNHFFI
jgi:replication factor A1